MKIDEISSENNNIIIENIVSRALVLLFVCLPRGITYESGVVSNG